jgi:hypothetical protein
MGLIRGAAHVATLGAVAPYNQRDKQLRKQTAIMQGASPEQVKYVGTRRQHSIAASLAGGGAGSSPRRQVPAQARGHAGQAESYWNGAFASMTPEQRAHWQHATGQVESYWDGAFISMTPEQRAQWQRLVSVADQRRTSVRTAAPPRSVNARPARLSRKQRRAEAERVRAADLARAQAEFDASRNSAG